MSGSYVVKEGDIEAFHQQQLQPKTSSIWKSINNKK